MSRRRLLEQNSAKQAAPATETIEQKPATTGVSYDSLSDDALVRLALKRGMTHLFKGWPRKTQIRKLEEYDNANAA